MDKTAINWMNNQSDLMRDICSPLKHLGIDHFTAMKSYDDGRVINLSTIDEWVKYYYEHELYISSEFEDQPSKYQSGLHYLGENEQLPVVSVGNTVFNSYNCYTVVIRQWQQTSFYFFSFNKQNKIASDIFHRNIDLIHQFIGYFNKKIHSISLQMKYLHRVQLKVENLKEVSSINNKRESIAQFKQAIGCEEENQEVPRLTEKEHQCLSLLLKGNGCKKIAQLMYVSPKTIEFHVGNIKYKFGCKTVIELISFVYEKHYDFALSLTNQSV